MFSEGFGFNTTWPSSNHYDGLAVAAIGVAAIGYVLAGRTITLLKHYLAAPQKIEEVAKLKISNDLVEVKTDNDSGLHRRKSVQNLGFNQPKTNISPRVQKWICPHEGLTLINFGKHKHVYLVANSPFVLKIADQCQSQLCKNEYTAYLISHKLGLNTVPFTAYAEKGKCNNHDIGTKYPKLEKIIADFPDRFLIIQENKGTYPDQSKINIQRAHQVLFYNLIAGHTATMEKSAMDKAGDIWEINNNHIGEKLDSSVINCHWLSNISTVWEAPISTDLINHILNLDEKVFEDLKSEFPIITQVIANLTALKKRLAQFQNKPVTFQMILSC